MHWEPIRKPPAPEGHEPNLADYTSARATFSWDAARAELDGLPDGRGLNIAHEAVDRHAAGERRDHVALRCLGRRGDRADVSYGELADASSRFANALDALGVRPGELVYLLMERSAPLFVAALGTLKHRSVLSPLFPAFGPEPVRQRIALGAGRVLVTTPALYRHKVAPVRDRLGSLAHVLVTAGTEPLTAPLPDGTVDLDELLARQSPAYEIPPTAPDDVALVHFTSGTTGAPKGAVHVHEAVVAHSATARMALDLRPDDVFWCTADPGWVTGTSYGVIAPLVVGATSVVDEGDFDAERWYSVLEEEGVTVWYTSPTALRMLLLAGDDVARSHDLGRLRFVASVGEPLDPELVAWGRDVLGVPVHDNWWQTETGGIMIANFASMDIRPGSMGRPLPGVEMAVVALDESGAVVTGADGSPAVLPPGERGELALRPGWPSMFRGYLGEDARYRACFVGGWYLTGDLVRRDPDGYVWFVGRGDDVIESAGHLVGPFEVESTLLEHPAVAEVGVVGVPDPVAGETVKAFVSLRPGFAATDETRLDLLGFARKRLGPAVAPRDIAFDAHLPHTESGKIVRRLLRDRAVAAARPADGTRP